MSSAVWANSTTFAPASRAASAISACRARRAAAGSPVDGFTPSQQRSIQSAPVARAAASQRRLQSRLSGFSR